MVDLIEIETNVARKASGPVSFYVALISGGMAGTTVDLALYPIDTLKTRMQASQGFRKAGGFSNIYKGVSAALIGSAPGAALFFTTYEALKPVVHRTLVSYNLTTNGSSDMDSQPLTHMLSACFGETAACLARVPTEVVKQRLQTAQYNSLSEAVTAILRAPTGLRGFYVGYGTTVMREIPFSVIQFPLWERLKNKAAYEWQLNAGSALLPWQGAVCGSVSGGFAAAVTTPLDVIKTRLMLGTDKNGKAYKGFVDTALRIFRDEGSNAFFKGIAPRTFWIFTGGFFFFGAYEKSKALLLKRNFMGCGLCDDVF